MKCGICLKDIPNKKKYCSRECYYLAIKAGKIQGRNSGWSKGLTKETDARIKRMSESLKGRAPWVTKEDKSSERYINWIKAIAKINTSSLKRMLASTKTRKDWEGNEERRKKQSERMKKAKLWENPDFVKKWHLARRRKKNGQEKRLEDFLKTNFPNRFVFSGDGRSVVGSKSPDFLNEDEKKIIELYGVFWHRFDDGKNRVDYYSKLGYSCLVIWEDELEDSESLRNKIAEFLESSDYQNVFRKVKERKIQTKECVICKEIFTVSGTSRKTCGKKCRNIRFAKTKSRERTPVTCAVCEKTVWRVPSQKERKFCSRKCYWESMKGKKFINPYKPEKNSETERIRRQKISMNYRSKNRNLR